MPRDGDRHRVPYRATGIIRITAPALASVQGDGEPMGMNEAAERTMNSTSTQLLGTGLYQLAYATNDFEQALGQCAAIHGVREFAKLPRIDIDLGSGRTVVCNLALAWVGPTQLEVIQPLEGEVAVYAEGLPSSGFGLKLHHLARLHA